MLKTSIYLLIIVLLVNTTNALTFTEVNYNPPGDDNNKEYIELFSSQPQNLSNFTIEDLSSSDTLVLLKQSNSNYYLIVEEGFDYSLIEANIYSAGSAIGNNLNNGNDQITLKDENNTTIDTFSYNSDLGANNNGKTLCKPQNTLNWTECDPSPGLENTLPENNTNEPQTLEINAENNTNQQNNEQLAEIPKIIINEILPNPIGDDSDQANGEWIELYNQAESLNIEGLILKDSSGKTVEISPKTTKSLIIGKNSYALIFTGIKSGFLNNDQESEISLYKGDNKIDAVSYENAEEGMSFSRINNKMIITSPTPNQPNIEEFQEEEKSNKINENSYLKITDVKENEKYLEVTLQVYKSNTQKEVIEIYAEELNKKISNIAKIKILSKNVNLTLTTQLTLKEGTNNNIQITAEGLDSRDSFEISLKENVNLLMEKTETLEDAKVDLKSTPKGENKESLQIYESKRLKSKDYAIYLFIISLIIIVIALIYKNDKI